MMTQEMAPWDRQPSESLKAFQAFSLYCDLGNDRSVRAVAATLHKSLSLIARWSAHWHWQDRLTARDAYIDAQAIKAEIEARREMSQRHAKIATLVLTKIVQRLIGDESQRIAPLDVNTLDAADIRALMDAAVRIERLSRGDATSRAEVSGPAGQPIPVRTTTEWHPDAEFVRAWREVFGDDEDTEPEGLAGTAEGDPV